MARNSIINQINKKQIIHPIGISMYNDGLDSLTHRYRCFTTNKFLFVVNLDSVLLHNKHGLHKFDLYFNTYKRWNIRF